MRKFRLPFFIAVLFIATSIARGQDTYVDNFQSTSYSNNNGTQSFSTNWVESGSGETTNPNTGRIQIRSNQLRLRDLDFATIIRTLDLSTATSAILSFNYNRTSGNESVIVQLYNGTSYSTVATLSGTGIVNYALSTSQMSVNSRIRFLSGSGYWGSTETMYIDNIIFTATTVPDDPPVVTGTGSQIYCAGASMPVAQTVSITDPDDTSTSAVYIQISNGYVNGEDVLTLTGTHPNISGSWDVTEGKLTLQGPALYSEFETAILASEFSSGAPNPTGTRQFSITVGEPNFLPSTQHYYEFVSASGITWTDAQIAASNRTYFGLQGYLATLISQEEADFSGSQAQGVGWIGANDTAVEGEWRWVTGPEAGTQFWSGNVGGTELTYAFWNSGEPNNVGGGGEDYAHITDNSVGVLGSWNDLPNGGGGGAYAAQGYVVEYGGMFGDPILYITLTTTIEVSNCHLITNKRITYRVNKN